MATARNTFKFLFLLLLTAGAGLYLNTRHHHHRQYHPALVTVHVHLQKQVNKQTRPSFDPQLPEMGLNVETPYMGALVKPVTPGKTPLSSALPAPSTRGPPAA